MKLSALKAVTDLATARERIMGVDKIAVEHIFPARTLYLCVSDRPLPSESGAVLRLITDGHKDAVASVWRKVVGDSLADLDNAIARHDVDPAN